MRSQLLALAMGAAFVAWWSCSGTENLAGSNQTDTISVGNYYFAPYLDSVTAITPGANGTVPITFLWEIGGVTHNITWDSGPGTVPAGSGDRTSGSWVVSLGVGTYTYHCPYHSISNGMNGTIVVSIKPGT
jgi:plastocyanin